METLCKAAAVAIAAAVLAALIRKDNPAMALLVAVAAGCAVLLPAVKLLGSVGVFLEELASASGMPSAVLATVLKTLGLAVLTRFAADFCKEAGTASAASAVELLGSVSALYVSLPLMKTVFQMIKGLL